MARHQHFPWLSDVSDEESKSLNAINNRRVLMKHNFAEFSLSQKDSFDVAKEWMEKVIANLSFEIINKYKKLPSLPKETTEEWKKYLSHDLLHTIKISQSLKTSAELLSVYDEDKSYLAVDNPMVRSMLLDPKIEDEVNEMYLNNPVYYCGS